MDHGRAKELGKKYANLKKSIGDIGSITKGLFNKSMFMGGIVAGLTAAYVSGCGDSASKHQMYTCASGAQTYVDTCSANFPDYIQSDEEFQEQMKDVFIEIYNKCESDIKMKKTTLDQMQPFFQCIIDVCAEQREPISKNLKACNDNYAL